MKGELLENRIVVWNRRESRDLFANGYFGKPIGIPKPNVNDINVPLILDLIEGCYLQETSKIKITKDGKKVSEGFIYSSGNNNEWMTIEQLQNFLKSPQYRELQDLNI